MKERSLHVDKVTLSDNDYNNFGNNRQRRLYDSDRRRRLNGDYGPNNGGYKGRRRLGDKVSNEGEAGIRRLAKRDEENRR